MRSRVCLPRGGSRGRVIAQSSDSSARGRVLFSHRSLCAGVAPRIETSASVPGDPLCVTITPGTRRSAFST